MNQSPMRSNILGDWIVTGSGVVGLCVAIYEYFAGPGIAGTPGVGLVIVSTALIAAAGLAVATRSADRHWLYTTLVVLLFLGLIGTILAGYFLEATLLVVVMLIGLIGWGLGRAPATTISPPTVRPMGQPVVEPKEAAR